jgi:uncharacterized repeat protein (TIGR03803 family)
MAVVRQSGPGLWRGILPALAVLAIAGTAGNAADAPFRVAHDFCTTANCADGVGPRGGVVFDASRTLYGVTMQGGANSGGTAFAVGADGRFRTLYDFCAQSCRDGNAPQSGLVVDVNGNLYGATPRGGDEGGGTIFRLSPNPSHARWKLRTLHGFCAGTPCADGTQPSSRLTYQGAASGQPYDGFSPLYGTTGLGGWNDAGVVFELRPDKTHGWKERVIYTFCSQAQCADGGAPVGLTMDGSGDLYVATHGGGLHNGGTVLALTPAKSREWHARVLYSFCARMRCNDGSGPSTTLLRDAKGNLYGGTSFGGNARNAGVVFKLETDGAHWNESVLHVFCAERDCTDGQQPTGAFVMDGAGALYGLAADGGQHALTGGALWRLDGTGYTLLHSFCRRDDSCTRGEEPVAGLSMDAAGRLYGETSTGGARNDGTLFALTP